MRIKSVSIKNFRALRSLSLNFSNMTVIIGENDCGKTSVMLALEVFFEGRKLNDPADYFNLNPLVLVSSFPRKPFHVLLVYTGIILEQPIQVEPRHCEPVTGKIRLLASTIEA